MAQCTSGFQVRDKSNGTSFSAPCGKCHACLARRTSGWSFRLVQEDKHSLQSHFVTLTYDNDHIRRTENGFMTLRKKDVQDFMKRLRYYSNPSPKIKYYAAGEYGSKTRRPHYHLILFNADPDKVELAWRDKAGTPLGSCYFGTVSAASVGYTLKYISKGKFKKRHSRDDRVPEFSLMSTGLGLSYLTDAIRAYHEADMYNRMYLTYEGNKKMAMPRYYKDKLYTKEQRQHIGAYQASRMEQEQAQRIKDYGPNYYRDKAEADKAALASLIYRSNKNDSI